MHNKTLAELSHALSKKEFTSVALTQHYLDRITALDPQLNALITVTPEHALQQARLADARIAKGEHTALTGIPMIHKDIFMTSGIKTSCASKMLDNFTAPYDATVVERLSEAGMVMLGKANMDEFAMGSSNENSYYGPTHNPWDLERVPGGSSGGSAAAVAARLAPLATGTDTGGSIRQPAAFCGITGLKPTYGRVSRYGMVAFASSLDCGGPLTASAEDAAMIMNHIAGHDPRDSTCVNEPVPDYTATLNNSLKGVRIGLPQQFFAQGLHPDIAAVVRSVADFFTQQGAVIVDIALPNIELGVAAYYIVAPAECSANLARYDGVRYGYRCDAPKDLEDLYKRSRSEGFGEEVKARIMVGTYALCSGYYDAYYLKAQKIRRLIRDDFKNAFENVDLILGPTTPVTAFKLGEKTDDPMSMYLSDQYTIPNNLAGVPGISFPAGMADGLPIGVQLTANYFNESLLLNAAHRFQDNTDWHRQHPHLKGEA